MAGLLEILKEEKGACPYNRATKGFNMQMFNFSRTD